jgi:hypothetical protein
MFWVRMDRSAYCRSTQGASGEDMKIKTNIRAGAGANAGGVNAGGTGGGSTAVHSSQNNKAVDVVPVIVGGINPISRCYGL